MQPETESQLALTPENQTTAMQGNPIMPLIEMAMEKGNLDVVRELMQLKREWDADEARKAFNVAMAAFKTEPPRIEKNKHVNVKFKDGGGMEYDHATLDHVVGAITPALSKFGIRHRWVPEQKDGRITITCVLSHDLGHCESTTLSAPIDISGKKNPIQAEMSTVTYLQRYTLLSATGMAASGQDDDGHASEDNDRPRVSEPQLAEWITHIRESETPERVKPLFINAFTSAKNTGDDAAADEILAALVKLWIGWIMKETNSDNLVALYKEGYKVIHPTGNMTAEKELIAAKDKRKQELK